MEGGVLLLLAGFAYFVPSIVAYAPKCHRTRHCYCSQPIPWLDGYRMGRGAGSRLWTTGEENLVSGGKGQVLVWCDFACADVSSQGLTPLTSTREPSR